MEKGSGTIIEIKCPSFDTCKKQADEIEQLRTGNRLHLELAEIQNAENQRLREALQLCVEAIGEWEKDPNSKDQYLPRIMFRALRLAQSALQQKDTK